MNRRLIIIGAMLATLGGPSSAHALESLFVRFSGIPGDVVDRRHTGWLNARSWAPTMPAGKTCTTGFANCLAANGQRITLVRRPDRFSQTLRDAAAARTRFDEVTLEDYEDVGIDFVADTHTFQGVRIVAVTPAIRKFRRVEVVTFVYERRSGHTATWSEAGLRGPPAQ